MNNNKLYITSMREKTEKKYKELCEVIKGAKMVEGIIKRGGEELAKWRMEVGEEEAKKVEDTKGGVRKSLIDGKKIKGGWFKTIKRMKYVEDMVKQRKWKEVVIKVKDIPNKMLYNHVINKNNLKKDAEVYIYLDQDKIYKDGFCLRRLKATDFD